MSTPAATASAGRIHRLQLDEEYMQAVSDRAHAARPGRTALAVIGAILFAAGWLTAKAFRMLFFSGAWAFAAVAVGWRQARGEPVNAPSVEQLLRENEALRLENKRLTPTLS